jgi:hypothetical protein
MKTLTYRIEECAACLTEGTQWTLFESYIWEGKVGVNIEPYCGECFDDLLDDDISAKPLLLFLRFDSHDPIR